MKWMLALAVTVSVAAANAEDIKESLYLRMQTGHSTVSYNAARKNLFGWLHLLGNDFSSYTLTTLYCDATLTNDDFEKFPLEPMAIPDTTVVNTEHSWPQSKFTGKFSKADQKSDLHHLFPVLSKVNSIRGNHPYGNVEKVSVQACGTAVLGSSATGKKVFEPSDEDKGDVARAIFYFSIRYKAGIDAEQEATLREWHEMDPPDSDEILRNENIHSIQHNRNIFINEPNLVQDIGDF